MLKYTFKICYVESVQNVPANYISRSVEEKALEENDKGKNVIEQYLCEYAKKGLEMAEPFVVICRSSELE